MADFSISVDTYPMAASIDTVKGHVESVTGAVVAMQSAVVAAEVEASKKICSNVDNGFYVLMRSQLSQKMAACSSLMSSKLLVMKKFRQDIIRRQQIMTEDYNRICARYIKQFTALDKALESRVYELDKRAMEIGRIQHKLSTRNSDDNAKTLLYGEDIARVADTTVTAKIKVKTARALSVMSGDVEGRLSYSQQVEHVLGNESISTQKEEYIPVVLTQSDSMYDRESQISNVYYPENQALGNSELTNKVQDAAAEFEWSQVTEAEFEKVKSSFLEYLAQSGLDDRLACEMKRLFEEGRWFSASGDRGGGQ